MTDERRSVQPPLIKVALLGDSQVGKTSLMVRYVEGGFDQTVLATQGINFMEKTVSLRGHEVTFSIWDIGGHKDYESMLPLVCNDAAAILLMFDLTRNETLDSIRDWHRKARERNKCAMPMLVGVKFDQLCELPAEEQRHVAFKARQFADAIDAPLIFCSPAVPIHVTDVFKVLLIQLFGLNSAVQQRHQLGEPLLEYVGRRSSADLAYTCGSGGTASNDDGRGLALADTPATRDATFSTSTTSILGI
uniref:Septum-promoting GTP-binding protein 1 n=1 Tax=Calcidiscus leptoporus TaxID=127549 RepID=A0A7S0J1F9_9EUKA|mmetsp:Transcript_34269/g.80285  ORF Transcript_34269/g.80285 Transcript_34269/m.80285 type:complete len:248 (+) Transcript_34269:39-782(+)